MKNIAIASDHAGFELKKRLINYFIENKIEFRDFGTNSNQSCDYPDFAHPLAKAVENNEFEMGVSICGSGNGINMTVNKYNGIRSALCWNVEIAKLARQHNNANVCALPARFITENEALEILKAFLETEFEGGRHQNRIDKMKR